MIGRNLDTSRGGLRRAGPSRRAPKRESVDQWLTGQAESVQGLSLSGNSGVVGPDVLQFEMQPSGIMVGQGGWPQRIPEPISGAIGVENSVLDLAQRIAKSVSARHRDASSERVHAAARINLSNQLRHLAQQAAKENWDGYGARPVSVAAYDFARRFALMLSVGIPDPDASIDSDGDISFEWYRGPRRVFSISITGAGTLNYAGLFGPNVAHGTEIFSEGVPDAIALGLARVVRDDRAL